MRDFKKIETLTLEELYKEYTELTTVEKDEVNKKCEALEKNYELRFKEQLRELTDLGFDLKLMSINKRITESNDNERWNSKYDIIEISTNPFESKYGMDFRICVYKNKLHFSLGTRGDSNKDSEMYQAIKLLTTIMDNEEKFVSIANDIDRSVIEYNEKLNIEISYIKSTIYSITHELEINELKSKYFKVGNVFKLAKYSRWGNLPYQCFMIDKISEKTVTLRECYTTYLENGNTYELRKYVSEKKRINTQDFLNSLKRTDITKIIANDDGVILEEKPLEYTKHASPDGE